MFSAYIDDSGTDPNQRAAISTALIIPTAQVIPLEREWDGLRTKYKFSDFHTSEMVFLNHKSEFASWDEEKQSLVFKRVREMSKKYGVRSAAISIAVNKADYDELVPLEYRNHLGGHYTWAVRHIMQFLGGWSMAGNAGRLEYVFDWMEPRSDGRKEVEIVMAQSESISKQRGRPGEFANYSFRRRRDLPALQCVDALSWTCYQQALFQFYKAPVHKLADEAWKDYGGHLEKHGWLQSFTITRKNLEKWIAAEIADGDTLKRFIEWELSGIFRDPGPPRQIT